ncbi:DNA-directed RNA polymerase III subunit RPC4 [Entelurus aequoreus]|uniref:DNA-directed RNA polymerase III subunit RPC4 n=1 Tax=Entelurus aequoreus TaxID=161455 RepID=UPI002B1E2EF8|nr:DNA-directed RNA polymerase III subunit RPC4 [Entelurus aequoreus]XP_061912401.1 DNA-directed RNA polymerase III subunit RPC4 [Entelurus aequoreus]XP_061912402.1 DNA-directed RNA polymerase III subunit RPC4 [Entelurus aequoreus]XP_061912403.1 DNA-directed RNA polymerase III subunit RPC4 [Entelurus aequoreus]XP_061912404.1 DNA-directed RNA polymerase III subunit RPC4 [Entelurus aequoreus]
MDTTDAESLPRPSGITSAACFSLPASRGLPGLGPGSVSSPTTARRLTSLRTRDLTLGGAIKKKKKTFEPNIHAVRKSKDDLKEEVRVAPKRGSRQRDGRRRENRGRRKAKPETIQSHSIFEQGPADTLRKTGWIAASDVCDSDISPTCKPVKQERKESDEDELLRKLQRDDFICDPSLRNDAKLKPIQLPLCQKSTECQEKPPLLRPPSGAPQVNTGHNNIEQPSLVKKLEDLRLSDREELFFMQLPDCMPARAKKANCAPEPRFEKVSKKSEDKKPVQGKEQESRSVRCSPVLSEFPEGFLGKLQIRKSGKVELKLGDIIIDVTDGAAFSFLQQLVSVSLSDGKNGDMMVLGNVQHKLVLSPNFQTLVEQSTSQQS